MAAGFLRFVNFFLTHLLSGCNISLGSEALNEIYILGGTLIFLMLCNFYLWSNLPWWPNRAKKIFDGGGLPRKLNFPCSLYLAALLDGQPSQNISLAVFIFSLVVFDPQGFFVLV